MGWVVVVVEEVAVADLEFEQPSDPGCSEDLLGGPPDRRWVLQSAGPDSVLQRQQLGLAFGHQLGGPGGVTAMPLIGLDHHRPGPIAQGDLGCPAVRRWDLHPLGRIALGEVEGFGTSGVAVKAGGHDVIEPPGVDVVDVGSGDESPVSDDTDVGDAEPVGQIRQHTGQGGHISGVAGEHVMSDRDPIPGAQQADHHLGPVVSLVTGVPERFRWEPVRGARVALEIGGRQVVANHREIHVGEVAQPGIQLGLGCFLGGGDDVEGPVVLVQRWGRPPLGHRHIPVDPFDQTPFRAGIDKAVGHHREHRLRQRFRAAVGALFGEPGVQPEAFPYRSHRSS